MKIAKVTIKTINEEFAGETRKVQRTSVRVVPIEVASIATEATFIPLDTVVPVSDKDSIVNILPVASEFDFAKDQKLTNFKAVDLAKLKAAKHFEFFQKKFRNVAIVELPAGTIHTRDPYRQPESYPSQVALIPVWGETTLPAGARLAGVIECEGYAISAQDEETGEEYFLGYRFDSDDQVNWVELVFSRRKHWKAAEKDEDFAPQPVKTQSTVQQEEIGPVNLVHVKDRFVLRQLKRLYPHTILQSQELAGRGWLIEDPDRRLDEAVKYVDGQRDSFANQGKNVAQAMEREYFSEMYQ